MAQKQPYIPLYIGDWEQDTNCLSVAAEGAWLKIVFKMWKTRVRNGIYKTSTNSLQNLWRIHEVTGVFAILRELTDNDVCDLDVQNSPENEQFVVFTNRRMVREYQISMVRTESVSKRYKKTSTKPLQNKKKQSTKPLHPSEYDSDIDSDTIIGINSNKGKVLKIDFEGTETALPFDTFWELYDKKIDRKACEKKWVAVSEADRVKIADHVPRYKEAQPDKQYRKNPETFLNNASWNDEIITRNATSITPPSGPGNGKMGTSAARVDALSKW